VDEGSDVFLHLSNAGLQQRPDLVDSHTVHWHGFRNAIPLFDGVPEMSVSVPIGADFTYYYKPTDPGTYMYHCHFEDVEHIHMGMTGVVFVRPKQNAGATVGTKVIPAGKYVYNDGLPPSDPNSTAYDREWVIFLSEVWATAHYNDAHIQPTDWSEYHSDFWLMNGRVYPDTILPNFDPVVGGTPGSDAERLQYQPMSSLITCKAGEKVLIRTVSLGYTQSAMTIPGINLRVVGKDATYLESRTLNADGLTYTNSGTFTTFDTNTVYIGPGEATDAIFTAPAYQNLDPVKGYDTYLLYNRNYGELASGSTAGYGGQMTEIHVYPTTATLLAQTAPNT
jgi:FtsP/CotA-like multicopper oxidase with cupredoxin domain